MVGGVSDYANGINAAVFAVARRHRDQVEALLAALPVGASLCVHEELPRTDWQAGSSTWTFTIRSAAHVLAAGETCDEPAQRTQYGPMTAELLAQAGG